MTSLEREGEATANRYKHMSAAEMWDRVGRERPQDAAQCEILSRWMRSYADADARAEVEFRSLAGKCPL